MGSIPVAVIEENLDRDIGHHIHIGSRYNDHRRGCRSPVYRRGSKHPDIHIDSRGAFNR
jgi:hypothetical protein